MGRADFTLLQQHTSRITKCSSPARVGRAARSFRMERNFYIPFDAGGSWFVRIGYGASGEVSSPRGGGEGRWVAGLGGDEIGDIVLFIFRGNILFDTMPYFHDIHFESSYRSQQWPRYIADLPCHPHFSSYIKT